MIRLVVGEALSLTGIGMATGMGAALLVARIVQSHVHGLPGLDVLTLTATPGLLTLVVVAAAVMPLRRALHVSPTIALRAE